MPLKIKIFMWFLYRKEILTKDNLIKRRWAGCKKCVFCDADETVDHLFVSCDFARKIWRLVHFTFSITPPMNVTNLFGTWLNGVDKDTKASIRVGVCDFLWAIWNCRNDVIFNNLEAGHFLQVVHRATHWIHMWSMLLPAAQRGRLDAVCSRLMAVVRAIFSTGGWLHARRLL